MKRIPNNSTIEPANPASPYTAHRHFGVHLGNRRRILFNSRRDALQFTADTNRWLNALLLEANTYYSECHADYRMAWPLLAGVKSEDLQALDVRLNEALLQVAWHLDKAALKHRTEALYHAWTAIARALSITSDTFGHLESFYRYKTQGVLRWRMAMRKRACDDALERMAAYGDPPPTRAMIGLHGQ